MTDREEVARWAAARCEDNDAFGYYLDAMWEREGHADTELDALVNGLAAEVTAGIDCTQCANCCRMPVGVTPDDIPRLAEGLALTPDAVLVQVVDRDAGQAWGEWAVMRGVPCPLLAGSRCSRYPHRPGACRAYPALTPDFRWLYESLANDAGLCPIIFNVIERLSRSWGGRRGC